MIRRLATNFGIVLIGAVLIGTLGRPFYLQERAKSQEAVREWIAAQRCLDRAYKAEVEAERIRWEEMEKAERKAPVMTPVVKKEIRDSRIPDEVEDASRKWGQAYDIDPELLQAVAWTESRFDPEAVNGGCVGLMQISPKWHGDRITRLGYAEEDLMTADGSIAVAADYIAELRESGHDDRWVLMTYNGDSRAESYLRGGEASEYAETVLMTAEKLQKTHAAGASASWLKD